LAKGRYAPDVDPRTDEQGIDEVQRMVHGAMERAMQAGGLRTARGLAQALRERGYSVSERTVTGWRSRESAIPAWALVAFSQISGLSLDTLMGLEDAASLAESVARHDRIIGEMQATLIEVCEKVGVPWHPGQNHAHEGERTTG
jgi:hypothetical protein